MKLIITLILQLVLIEYTSAKTIQSLSDSLLTNNSIEEDITFFSDSISTIDKKLLYWKTIYEGSAGEEELSSSHYLLGKIYQQESQADKAIHHFEKSNEFSRNYSSQIEIAKTYIQLQRFNLAKIYLLRLSNTNLPLEKKKQVYTFLISIDIIQENYINAIRYINDLDYISNHKYSKQLLDVKIAMMKAKNESNYKTEKKAGTLSTFFPGLGQLYTNSYKDAFNAIVLNSATTFLLVQKIISKNFIGFTITASTLWWRFYSGNIDNAKENVNEFNSAYLKKHQTEAIRILNSILLSNSE